MTDRELLELAAKAAGYEIHVWGTPGEENVARMDQKNATRWNPLLDDGDALRLAVKLSLWEAVRDGYQHVDSSDDLYAATRRAIVRAAAAMAKD